MCRVTDWHHSNPTETSQPMSITSISRCCAFEMRSGLLLLSALSLLPALGGDRGRLRAAEPIEFNRDIRPLLADRCFGCHGPDAGTRKAGLRLDQESAAKSALAESGHVPIVNGKPQDSEIMRRITDPENRMPPTDSNLSLTPEEIERIRRWIAAGAKWERHWAFLTPKRSRLPAVRDADWPRNVVDHFVLAGFEARGLQPAAPATKPRWLRRVTFDLTGLPPTPAELDAFVADQSQSAYERVVDRLLDSPAFGERMAQEWLDVARYGDTDGLFEDHPRSIYPWRDWVVQAFNTNLPYSDFLTWQLAGDLLPNATVAQRIATGFIRNNPTSNEGGIIDEDYRVKYLVDRVNTTATAMLGLTLECAQCHDHKYDPMTQREYYQFAGFFNSLVGKGNTKGATAPTLKVYTPQQTNRLADIEKQLAQITQTLKSNPPQLATDFAAWLSDLEQPVDWQPTRLAATEALSESSGWIQAVAGKPAPSAQPTIAHGRFVRVALPPGVSGFLTISEVQVFSGNQNVARAGTATQSSVDYNSPAAKAIDGNHNGSFASCSCTKSEKDAWWEIDLGRELPISSVAVWNRTDCCPERLDRISIQILDDRRKQRLTHAIGKAQSHNGVPAGTKPRSETGLMFTLPVIAQPGTITALQWETKTPALLEVLSARVLAAKDAKPVPVKFVGKTKLTLNRKPVLLGIDPPLKLVAGQRLEIVVRSAALNGIRLSTTGNSTALVRATLPKKRPQQLEHFRKQWPGFQKQRAEQARLTKEKQQLDSAAPVTMIASDAPQMRAGFLLLRGEYDKRGEAVPTAAPASIMAFPESFPANRLGLARWLTDPAHPLTARVVVNRYWQMCFGVGIVKTSEDLGTQGELPSHPALLDQLSVDFVTSGWDVKALLRKLVTSATYRQSSVLRDDLARRDPENRWLARGPRRRLPAEFLRDNALAISGLLVDKRGGPGVHPYQPAVLFGANAIGAAGTKFTQSSGPNLYRRSLYTYWKRQIPAANLRILGADGRTKCRTRREMTNTPLQALVMLNDPQFVEAARVLAQRVYQEGGNTPAGRITLAFRLATSRRPRPAELQILLNEFQDRLQEFSKDPAAAKAYLQSRGQHKSASGIPESELAAYAAVASLILNLDESLTSS